MGGEETQSGLCGGAGEEGTRRRGGRERESHDGKSKEEKTKTTL